MTASSSVATASQAEARARRIVEAGRKRALDPVERFAEIIFGLIMVLGFTGSLSVARGGEEAVRDMLAAALGCNVAWGVVDGVMYVVTSIVQRSRVVAVIEGIRSASPAGARAIVLAALPEGVASVTDDADADRMVARARALPALPVRAGVQLGDLKGALASCLLVLAATFPPTIPFLLVDDVQRALRLSNAVAVASLFLAGWSLGRVTGVRAWLLGLAMVLLGVVLVGLTVALGG